MSYQQVIAAYDALQQKCKEFFEHMLSADRALDSANVRQGRISSHSKEIAAELDVLLVLIEGLEVSHIATVQALREDPACLGGWADKFRHLQRENGQLRLALADQGVLAHAVNDEAIVMAERVRRQLQELEVSFFKDIAEPPKGLTGTHQEITARICGPEGLNWDWTEPYMRNGQFAWCGAEAAYALRAAGLKPSIRRRVMPSCYRLYEFCHNEDNGKRVVPHISKAEPGDIVVVGNEQSPRWGSHITTLLSPRLTSAKEQEALLEADRGDMTALGVPSEHFAGIALDDTLIGLERWKVTLEIFQGIRDKESGVPGSPPEGKVFLHEGNAKAYGPDGTYREGVGRRWRPMVPGRTEYGVMYVYRFLPSDYVDISQLEVL